MNRTNAYTVYSILRDDAGLTDYKVSKATGISTSVLAQWKRGAFNLKVEKVQKLASFFSVPVGTFYEGSAEAILRRASE